MAYSVPYTIKAAARLLLSEGGAMGQAPGYTLCAAHVDRLLLRRYGCRLAEIPFNPETPIEYLLPNVPGFVLPPLLQSARVQQWPTVGCTVLHYNNRRYLTPMEVDNVSRTFLCWLCLGIVCKPHRFVLVDAEPAQQRALATDIHRASWSQVVWLADSVPAAMNLADHLGGGCGWIPCPPLCARTRTTATPPPRPWRRTRRRRNAPWWSWACTD